MRTVPMRLLLLFCWCAGLSSVITLLSAAGIISSEGQSIGVALFAGMLVFIAVHVLILRGSYFLSYDDNEYYYISFISYLIFAVASMLIRPMLGIIGKAFGYGEFGRIMHTWIFGIFKFAMFSKAELGWAISSLFGHVLSIVAVFVAPMGIRR